MRILFVGIGVRELLTDQIMPSDVEGSELAIYAGATMLVDAVPDGADDWPARKHEAPMPFR